MIIANTRHVQAVKKVLTAPILLNLHNAKNRDRSEKLEIKSLDLQ